MTKPQTFAQQTSSHHAPPEVHAAVEAIKRRLSWPSMHWGAEDLHPDALPHIAAAALDSLGLTEDHRTLDDGWAMQSTSPDGQTTSKGKPNTRQRRLVTPWGGAR